MKLLVVRYRRDRGQDDPDQAAQMHSDAAQIARLPGLAWKTWIYDDANHVAGGIYLFDDDEHARAWGDQMMPAALGQLPGVSDIQTDYYDVDEELSEITRGPVRAAAGA